ncbi:MAG: hypothetical protein PHP31_05465 [Lentimicrobiaceae bacterium]|nr:hypothetical protein [Lentimicrobiaceae bacterium]
MKKKDLIFIVIVLLIFLPFFIIPSVYNFYVSFNEQHGMIMAFIKFSILATMGEVIALRIRTGNYNEKGFGIVPRMIVWGVLGLTINAAFKIFATGVPQFLAYMGLENAPASMGMKFSGLKFVTALSISTAMNITFGVVMMTFHKITDMHIYNNGGTVKGLFKPIQFKSIIKSLNWDVMYGFIYKKTIPLFWIPAHTIVFLLPESLRILVAALLGVALGLILALAKSK